MFMLKWGKYSLKTLAACIALYFAMVAILGLIPVNTGAGRPNGDIAIYLDSNGVHTDLVLQVRNAVVDWSQIFRPTQVVRADLAAGAPFISIGWGSRTFFLHTREWSDLTAGNAIRALTHDQAVMHTTFQGQPHEGQQTRKIMLNAAQYGKLVDFVQQSVARETDRKAVWLNTEHYGRLDAFYAANGHYTPFETCNEWTRQALASAGIRTASWAPFGAVLFWWLG